MGDGSYLAYMPLRKLIDIQERREDVRDAIKSSSMGIVRAAKQEELAAKWKVSTRQIRSDVEQIKLEMAQELSNPEKRQAATGTWLAQVEDLHDIAKREGDYSAAAACLRLKRDALGLAERLEISGPGGGAVQVVALTPEQARLEADRARRIARGEEEP